MSSASTAVPSDEDFLTSWDEWGDIESGGIELPKAENHIDFKNGKVNAAVSISRGSCHQGDMYGTAELRRSLRGHVVSHNAAPSLVNDVLSDCVYEFKPQ